MYNIMIWELRVAPPTNRVTSLLRLLVKVFYRRREDRFEENERNIREGNSYII